MLAQLATLVTFARRVPVDFARLATPALQTFVLVPTALQQTKQHALPTMPIFVRLVPVNFTRLATPALDARRVALVKEKRLRALRHRIVFVLKTFVLVPTALHRRAQHVLPMVPIFVRRVPVAITRLATHALDVPVDNTKNKVGNPLANHVPGVLTAV